MSLTKSKNPGKGSPRTEYLARELAREKEKLRGLTLPEKIQYILDYYWLWILGTGCAVFLICFIIFRIFFVPKDYWFYGMFANTAAEAGNGSALWRDFTEYAGYDTKEKKVELNATSWFDPSIPGGTNNSYFQAFVALAESGDLDVVTLPEEALKALGSSGRLLDLSAPEKCENIYQKYADRLVYCDPYDEDYAGTAVPVGIDLSDSLLVTKYGLYEESCVLGICAWTGRMDSVETFLEFALPRD